tara:strand:+ start:165 stop:749 length:585 start_codon:yes stop_codon:yes gene_type:complete
MSVYIKKDNKGKKRNDTPTPYFLCEFLHDIIIKHYNPKIILDTSAGDKRLTYFFKDSKIINYEIKEGTDFLKETNKIECDLCIMNPPFNIGTGRKLAVEVFMDHLLTLIDNTIPIIMICPMGFRLNQRIKSKRWIKMRDEYPAITTIISLPLNVFDKTLYHSEVVCFNTNKMNPHYFIDDKYINPENYINFSFE